MVYGVKKDKARWNESQDILIDGPNKRKNKK